MANFTAGTSFTDGVTNDVTAAKLNALVADAVPTSNLSLNSTTGTIATFNSTTGTIPTLVATTLITTGTGTAAAPAIVPTGDTNTGIFFPAADTISFSEGGAEAVRIDSSGNVGIGTTSPAGKLHVNGQTYIQGTVSGGLANSTLIANASGQAQIWALGPNASTVGSMTFVVGRSDLSSSNQAITIDSSGNVGVGTASPTAQVTIGKVVNSATLPSTSANHSISLYPPTTTGYYGGGISWAEGANTAANICAVDDGASGALGLVLSTGNNSAITERLRIDSSGNVIVSGNKSLISNGAGGVASNTSIGSSALASNSTGVNNTASGVRALSSNTTGYNNTASGVSALSSNTTGYQNTASGLNALFSNSTGYNNTASGLQALYSNTTGYQNTASGVSALYYNTTGYNNTASGVSALVSNSTGYQNTASGFQALYSNTTGYQNTASGESALYSNTTGYSNTASGVNAGYGAGSNSNTTGANNTFIGNGSVGASATADNVITLGNGSIATLRCQVTSITALSDKRDKKDIENLSAGLDFVGKLRPVSFVWNTRDKAKVNIPDAGFIAQELLDVQEATGITIPNLVSQENPEKLEAAYATLIPVLVQAIKELKAKVESLEEKNK